MPAVVVSLLPRNCFVISVHDTDSPRKLLERWRRSPSRISFRLPVAVIEMDNPALFLNKMGAHPGMPYRLSPLDVDVIRRCPLEDSWRQDVVNHAAKYPGAAAVLAQLL